MLDGIVRIADRQHALSQKLSLNWSKTTDELCECSINKQGLASRISRQVSSNRRGHLYIDTSCRDLFSGLLM